METPSNRVAAKRGSESAKDETTPPLVSVKSEKNDAEDGAEMTDFGRELTLEDALACLPDTGTAFRTSLEREVKSEVKPSPPPSPAPAQTEEERTAEYDKLAGELFDALMAISDDDDFDVKIKLLNSPRAESFVRLMRLNRCVDTYWSSRGFDMVGFKRNVDESWFNAQQKKLTSEDKKKLDAHLIAVMASQGRCILS